MLNTRNAQKKIRIRPAKKRPERTTAFIRTNAALLQMADKYRSFIELTSNETAGQDFVIRIQQRPGTIAVIAPHGGGIEPGTSEIAEAIAANDLSFYAFEGTKPEGNRDLHITSTGFDEPQCVTLLTSAPTAITIHGEESAGNVVFIGGRDTEGIKRLTTSLVARGFAVETHQSALLQGQDQTNICNRTASGGGMQLELSNGLRRSFFQSLTRTGRQTKTQHFHDFVTAVRAGLCQA
jgi:phage replication-related protein YjqB (UPF0714/DUF867 family)